MCDPPRLPVTLLDTGHFWPVAYLELHTGTTPWQNAEFHLVYMS